MSFRCMYIPLHPLHVMPSCTYHHLHFPLFVHTLDEQLSNLRCTCHFRIFDISEREIVDAYCQVADDLGEEVVCPTTTTRI